MKEFIKALFDEEQQIYFQYKDYDIAFYAGEFHSYNPPFCERHRWGYETRLATFAF